MAKMQVMAAKGARTGRPQHALGEQGLRLVKEAAEKAQGIERRALRRRVEEASRRPAPGTSELLSRALTVETHAVGAREVKVHDLVGMAPVHLRRREGGRG